MCDRRRHKVSRASAGGERSSGGDAVAPPPSPLPAASFLPPLALSLIIVATSPFMGQVRDVLLRSLGARFALVLAVGLGAAVAVAVIGAALRIREPRPGRRWLRLGGLALALVLLGIQVFGFGTGNPVVDAAERIHLLEYGLLGALFYRALRRFRDASVLPLTALAVALVGVVDELVQWWTPVRTGDVRDVLLNAYAGLCGLLFGLALAPPQGWARRIEPGTARRVGLAAALTVLGFAFFYDRAHLGYEITDPEIGRFRAWHTRERLLELEAERGREWAADPPTGLERMGPEDFYLTAAGWHVQHRNASYQRGDWFHAWKENRILEVYYEPFLELRSFGGNPVQHRLPPAQRQEIDAKRPRPDPVPYESPALGERVVVIPRPWFWAAVIAIAAVLALLPQACVPGMAQNWGGESPLARCSQSRRLGEGQGRHREVGS